MTKCWCVNRRWWHWLVCWGGCPCRPYQDAGGCGGQCVRCGKIVGYVTRTELRAYADRETRWWSRVYRAGIHADLVKAPRVPPDTLTDEQKEVWLAGYDR